MKLTHFGYAACLATIVLIRSPAIAVPDAKPSRGVDMDYGPFLNYSVLKPREPKPAGPAKKPAAAAEEKKPEGPNPNPPWKAGDLLATKGVAVKLDHGASICFDTETLRYAAGWT